MSTRQARLSHRYSLTSSSSANSSPSNSSSSNSSPTSSIPLSLKKPTRNTPNPWTKEELISLLYYINNNIDDWLVHPKLLCKKVIELNLIKQRSAHAIYQKVHNMINAMKVWLMEKRKGYETLIWSEENVNELLEGITKKILEKESESTDTESEQEENSPTGKKGKSRQEEATDDMDTDNSGDFSATDPACLSFSIPMLNEMYKIKLQEIENIDTKELKDLATEALNKKHEEVLGMVHNVYRKHEEFACLVHKTESKIQELIGLEIL